MIWMTAIRTGTKGRGYWDLGRDKKGLGTGQRHGEIDMTVTRGRTRTETRNMQVLGPEQGHGGTTFRTGMWGYWDHAGTWGHHIQDK